MVHHFILHQEDLGKMVQQNRSVILQLINILKTYTFHTWIMIQLGCPLFALNSVSQKETKQLLQLVRTKEEFIYTRILQVQVIFITLIFMVVNSMTFN